MSSEVDDAMAAMDRVFDALERQDMEDFAAILDEVATPDVEFTSAIGRAISGGTASGQEAVLGWFREFLDTLDGLRWVDRRYVAVNDRAFLVLTRFEAQGAASDVPIETEVGQLYEMENGRVRRGASFMSHAEARRAAEALHA